MAIKYYCDICENEIADLNEIGNFTYKKYEWNITKSKTEKGVRMREYLVCKECAEIIVGKIEELCKEHKKQIEKK